MQKPATDFTIKVTYTHTLMTYFALSPNGEESLNKFSSPDPDHLRGGPSHKYNNLCKKIK